MVSILPLAGGMFTLANRFLSPAVVSSRSRRSDEKGFACGWTYWVGYVFAYSSKLVSIQKIMAFWFPNTHPAIIISAFLPVPLLINCLPVRRYGDIEYWITLLKVSAVCGIILLGLLGTSQETLVPCPTNPSIGECMGRQGFACIPHVIRAQCRLARKPHEAIFAFWRAWRALGILGCLLSSFPLVLWRGTHRYRRGRD
jgi:amino acid transporter